MIILDLDEMITKIFNKVLVIFYFLNGKNNHESKFTSAIGGIYFLFIPLFTILYFSIILLLQLSYNNIYIKLIFLIIIIILYYIFDRYIENKFNNNFFKKIITDNYKYKSKYRFLGIIILLFEYILFCLLIHFLYFPN